MIPGKPLVKLRENFKLGVIFVFHPIYFEK